MNSLIIFILIHPISCQIGMSEETKTDHLPAKYVEAQEIINKSNIDGKRKITNKPLTNIQKDYLKDLIAHQDNLQALQTPKKDNPATNAPKPLISDPGSPITLAKKPELLSDNAPLPNFVSEFAWGSSTNKSSVGEKK